MSNFDFLKEHDPIFLELAVSAEKAFTGDPNTTLMKLRQLGEAFAQDIAARSGIWFDESTSQADLLFSLHRELRSEDNIKNLFHTLRIEGNKATHQFKTQHNDALKALQIARSLAWWYHKSFGKMPVKGKLGAFVRPKDPSENARKYQLQIEKLTSELKATRQELDSNQELAALRAQEKAEDAELARKMAEEARLYEQIALENEEELNKQRNEFEQKILRLQKELQAETREISKASSDARKDIRAKTSRAAKSIVLSEAETRIIIDQQLIEAGWMADTQELRYSKGTRPEKGKNKAIAEWPTKGNQSADYVLFMGLTPIATVEAKKENTNVSGKIGQAERYSRGFMVDAEDGHSWDIEAAGPPWDDGQNGEFQIPFAYSCNGRGFVRQLKEQSGVWFRDLRHPSNLKRALPEFHSPKGLLDILKRSKDEAEKVLEKESFAYLGLRDYQRKAIECVEEAVKNGQRECLLAMATGTGKTRTIIGLIYRFLKAERFKRILFLVDRNALGTQATDVFDEAPLEQNLPLSRIYNILELSDKEVEPETRVQVATVQSMVKRVYQSDTSLNIDTYDCIIIDEAHRGYTLDQEMTEGEMAERDAELYQSSYRRVLDHFDAVKIGLTATPAKHTTEIFNKPVFTYSYREAVADDWLIDYDPPIRFETLLTQKGIHFAKGEVVESINTQTGSIESSELEDDMKFDVQSFNRQVITEGFNKVICDELTKDLDPFGDEKTMIFCATDVHADMVKRLLDDAFKDLYQDQYNEAAVRKITGKSDRVDQLIRNYKNERHPSIAITVDLLTTGIDVPEICNLVFLRRVRSRILYEQMKGRATRRCDDIGKTVFTIYDPVDLYATLQEVDTMKPLVKNPNIGLDVLIAELSQSVETRNAESAPHMDRVAESPAPYFSEATIAHQQDVLDSISQKVMRVLRKAQNKSADKPPIQRMLTEMEDRWGVDPSILHKHLRDAGPSGAVKFFKENQNFLSQLAEVKTLVGSDKNPIISEHDDELVSRTQSWGDYERPQDYLESFNEFIRKNLNSSAALSVVVTRPKDLTREQLKEIRMFLDDNGYTEARLESAWRSKSNQDIAAGVIGFIRQAAIGESLVPFEERVAGAMKKIYAMREWSRSQRKWLERLSKQLCHEAVIDEVFINRTFSQEGGVKFFNRVLAQNLESVLVSLAENLWSDTGA